MEGEMIIDQNTHTETEMETEYKSGGNGGLENGVRERSNTSRMRGSDVVLRFFALAFSLAAAVILGVNKETATVQVTLVPSLPPVNVPATAKWHYLSAFVFFVVANAIACAHAGISLVLTLANRDGKKGITALILLLDLLTLPLLFSSIGAAAAIGLMGYKGNSHVQWNKVCNLFDKFCRHAATAIALSGAAALIFFLLLVLAILKKR